MRCCACDCELNNRESTRKFLHSGKYCDMCNNCLSTIAGLAPTEDSVFYPDDDTFNQGEDDHAAEG